MSSKSSGPRPPRGLAYRALGAASDASRPTFSDLSASLPPGAREFQQSHARLRGNGNRATVRRGIGLRPREIIRLAIASSTSGKIFMP